MAPGFALLRSGSTTLTHSNWNRAGSCPARGQPSSPLVAKNTSTKNSEVTTIAAAFTHQAKRDESPSASNSTQMTT
jgi:hypothetical protein